MNQTPVYLLQFMKEASATKMSAPVETITLSSSDDEEPPAKRIKPTVLSPPATREQNPIVLSDDEDNAINNCTVNTKCSDVPCVPIIVETLSLASPKEVNDNAATAGSSKCNSSSKNKSPEPSDVDIPKNDVFTTFLDKCVNSITNTSHKHLVRTKLPLIKKLHKYAGSYSDSEDFNKLMQEKLKLLSTNPQQAVSCFNSVFQELKAACAVKKCDDNNIPLEKQLKINKLEKVLCKLNKIVKKLENEEIGADDLDNENSPYIKLQKYKKRGAEIYDKICQLRGVNPHKDRIVYHKLSFTGSNYPEFNWTINRMYKNNDMFPTYYEMNKLLRKCATDKNMNLTEVQLATEILHCFKTVGDLLQKRRRQDLHNIHSDYLIESDPAIYDPELKCKLNINRKAAETALNALCLEYVQKQERGETVTSDSSNTDNSESDSDDNEKNGPT